MTEYSGLAARNNVEPLQLAFGLRHHFHRRLRFLQPRAQLRDLLVRAGVAFAELALNRLHLSAEVGLALRVAELRLHILLQALLDLRDLELRGDARLHRAHALHDIEFLEQAPASAGSAGRDSARGNRPVAPHRRCCARPWPPAPARPALTPAAGPRCRADFGIRPATR